MNADKKSANGLTLIALASAVEAGRLEAAEAEDWNALVNSKFGGAPKYAVFYLDYGIRFARWENGGWRFHPNQVAEAKYLQLGRIFNAQRELKIWRVEGDWHYRLRSDDENGDGEFAIDAEQNLWGTHAEPWRDDWTRLWEDRGTELYVPIPVAEIQPVIDENGQERKYSGQLACLKTRNYIGEMANGQATYVDCRFVGLRPRTQEEVFGETL